jgi:hypothetical protein
MTFFSNQTLTQNITKYFQYISNDGNFSHSKHPYSEINLKIPKSIIPHQSYLKIKRINIKAQISHNNYVSLKKDWQTILDSSIRLNFNYKMDNKNFSIKHEKISKNIIVNFNSIENVLSQLNPLYNNIDDLPILEFEILNDFEMSDGFEKDIEIIFKPEFDTTYSWKGFANDKFNQFYWTVIIDYQTEI